MEESIQNPGRVQGQQEASWKEERSPWSKNIRMKVWKMMTAPQEGGGDRCVTAKVDQTVNEWWNANGRKQMGLAREDEANDGQKRGSLWL